MPKQEPDRNRAEKPGSLRGYVERKDGRLLRRFTVYLHHDLSRRLAIHCADANISLSDFIAKTLESALDPS
jgi:predicted HicB family RNase H-like nuclease